MFTIYPYPSTSSLIFLCTLSTEAAKIYFTSVSGILSCKGKHQHLQYVQQLRQDTEPCPLNIVFPRLVAQLLSGYRCSEWQCGIDLLVTMS